MKKKWMFLLLFLIGVGIMLYPLASNVLALFTQSRVISSYQSTVSSMSMDEIQSEREQAVTYNSQLSGETDEVVEGISYLDLLNVGEVMGYIEIPSIEVYLPIYHGTSDAVLQKGIGHMEKTSLPVGGSSTHAVLTGHTGLPKAKLLTDLTKVAVGDQFYIHSLDEVLAYEVDQIKVVLPEETDDLAIEAGQDYVTLVTCTPYGINTHRLLVRGTRVPYVEPESETTEVSEVVPTVTETEELISTKSQMNNGLIFMGLGVVLVGLVVIVIRRRG